MSLGLRPSDLNYIRSRIIEHEEIERAVVFGSRAKGTHRAASDIDIAIFGPNVNFDTVARLRFSLQDEGPMPYTVDVVDYTHLTNTDIRAHIDRVGREIYRR